MPHRTKKIVTKFGLKTKSPDEAARLLSGTYAPVTVLPAGPTFDLEVNGVACGGVTAYRTSSNSGLTFESEAGFDGYNLAVPLSGGQVVKTGARHTVLEHATGRALLVDGAETKSACFLPDLNFKGLSLSTDLVHACLAQMCGGPITRRIHFAPLPDSGLKTAQFMLMLADSLFVGMEGAAPLASAPLAVASLNEALARMMLYGMPHSYSERLRSVTHPAPAPRSVSRAIEYMKAHAGEPISLTDIAQAADTSPRSLQEGFRRFRSTTPTIYLRSLRLYGARDDLLNPEKPASVHQIALRWGFTHMGMFSSYYRAAFGETPRQTLVRRGTDSRFER